MTNKSEELDNVVAHCVKCKDATLHLWVHKLGDNFEAEHFLNCTKCDHSWLWSKEKYIETV